MIPIRPATPGDADSLAPLLGALGYPVAADELRGRLKHLLGRGDAGAFVAGLDGAVAGLATYQLIELIYRPHPQCRLTALVVGAEYRRRGVARALVAAVESIARRAGCFRLEVTTRQGRDEALGFYAALGFEERPHRLVKALGGG